MSRLNFRIQHDQQFWTMHEKGGEWKHYKHNIGDDDTQISFGDFGIGISCEIHLESEDRKALAQCLVKEPHPGTQHIPLWHHLTPELHSVVLQIEKKIKAVARLADHGFRKTPKGVRLPPAKPQKAHYNGNTAQRYTFILWRVTAEEWADFEGSIDALTEPVRARYLKQGIRIPLSKPFDQKQIHLNEEEVALAFKNIDEVEDIPPFWSLYGIAWENFTENDAHDAAILILATAIETTLKWCLIDKGDAISNYLIDNMQSPPLKQLYKCASENTEMALPAHFGGWLGQLSAARNFAAHKPRGFEIDLLQIGRWFAVGEAILKAISHSDNDPLVGYLVKPIGEKAREIFAENTNAVVLRREAFHNTGENRLHVLVSTGETYYFSEKSFEKLSDKLQKFPDIS